MARRQRTMRVRSAYHEAGHAVACYLLGRRFKRVTIVPDHESHGKVFPHRLRNFHPDTSTTLRTRQRIETEITILFAGGLTEAKLLNGELPPIWRCGTLSDLSAAVDAARIEKEQLSGV